MSQSDSEFKKGLLERTVALTKMEDAKPSNVLELLNYILDDEDTIVSVYMGYPEIEKSIKQLISIWYNLTYIKPGYNVNLVYKFWVLMYKRNSLYGGFVIDVMESKMHLMNFLSLRGLRKKNHDQR